MSSEKKPRASCQSIREIGRNERGFARRLACLVLLNFKRSRQRNHHCVKMVPVKSGLNIPAYINAARSAVADLPVAAGHTAFTNLKTVPEPTARIETA